MLAKIKRSNLFTVIFSLVFFFGLSQVAQAASLYFSPASKSVNVGDIVKVSVVLNTAGENVNNAEATVSFPTEMLEVVSVAKGSVFSLWVEEPAFSNGAGTVSFNGGIPTPGFSGSAGNLISITFRAKKSGTASIYFASGAARANDGLGTDILSGMGQAQLTLVGKDIPATPEPETPAVTPPSTQVSSLQISSPSHPDQKIWYTKNSAIFNWSLPKGTNAVRFALSKNANAQPNILNSSALTTKTINDIGDGIWYFAVQARSGSTWSSVARYRINIDTTKPDSLDISIKDRQDQSEPAVSVQLDALDKISGIERYDISIDGGEIISWQDDGSHTYLAPKLLPGTHAMLVKAIDYAGNYLMESSEFTITAFDAPVINDYPKSLLLKQALLVRGLTRPNAQVTLWLQNGNETAQSFIVESDSTGAFTYVKNEGLSEGFYSVWAEAVDAAGAHSKVSAKIFIEVTKGEINKIGDQVVNFFSIAIVLAALSVLLLLIIMFIWRQLLAFKRRLKEETRVTEGVLNRAFDFLQDETKEQIKAIERVRSQRPLSVEEENMLARLKETIDKTEKIFKEEMNDIEKIK